MRIRHRAVICALVGTVSLASGCGLIPSTTQPKSAATETPKTPPAAAPSERPVADVVSVEVDGKPGAYTFTVRVRSPDLGGE